MSAFPLSLNPVVDVTTTVEAGAITGPSFQAGLIVGNSGVIPASGANSRIRQYGSTTAMLSDGYTSIDPEFMAAQLYFSPTPTPPALFVGAQDPTAAKTITVGATAGTGYVVGDVLSIMQGSASGATLKVTEIGAEGAVTTGTLLTQGTGYSVANGLATTGGTGTGAEINITAIGETPLQAVTACRLASANWYGVMVCGSSDADNEAIAAYVQSASPQSLHFYGSQDTSAATDSIFAQLQTQKIGRSFGHAATTQGGGYPSNVYVAAADMGRALGLNTGLPSSNFVMKFKSLPGIAAEPLSETQVDALEAQSANVYVTRGNAFTWLEQGTVASGQFLDTVMGIDRLISKIQLGVTNLFVSQNAVPQTDPGEALIMNVVSQACASEVTTGFLAPGVWTGTTVGTLTAGTAVPKGYLVQALSFATQSSGDQQARKGMPITVCVITANGIQSIAIGVTVQV
ncbi:MAG TPA: DUF3383 family protein [Acidobacteriaceae bacterium]|jgi:hypothetical protein